MFRMKSGTGLQYGIVAFVRNTGSVNWFTAQPRTCWKKCKKKKFHGRFTRVARVFCICEFPSWRNNKACRVCHNCFCASFPTYTTWDFNLSTFGFGKLHFVMSFCGLEKKESKSVRFEMTSGCVNNHIFYIFG